MSREPGPIQPIQPIRPIRPIEIRVEVDADPASAFATYVDRFADWWPAAYTWSGGAHEGIGIEPRAGGFCYERGPHGLRLDWGRVTEWAPPERLGFTWQIDPDRTPQPNPGHASAVLVTFEPAGAGCRVTLRHDGFERHPGDGAAYRDAMAGADGWPLILERYAARVRRLVEAPWEAVTT